MPAEPEILEAHLDRYIHIADEWAVARLESEDGRTTWNAAGEIAGFRVGDFLVLEGRFEETTFGRQFKVQSARRKRPSTALGVTRYLKGIPGIGPAIAEHLVREVAVDDEPAEQILERLARVQVAPLLRGMPNVNVELIQGALREYTGRDAVLIEIQSLGLGPLTALKLWRWKGVEALDALRADPWAVRRDVPGIGFAIADRIALRLGIPMDHPSRLRAGIEATLEGAEEQGHTALPRKRLYPAAAKLLDHPASRLRVLVDEMLEADEIYAKGDLLAAPKPWKLERRLAWELARRRVRSVDPLSSVPIDGVVLTDEQRDAVDRVLAAPVAILTGGPGTGKTTITRAIVAAMQAAKLDLYLASPTGKAARRLTEATRAPAHTIHRLLGYHSAEGWLHNRENPLEADAVLVDEASMLDVRLACRLVTSLPKTCRLILVGDADQLPSVGSGRVLCDLIDSGEIPTARLTRIFRQAQGSYIVTNAHALQRGRAPITGSDPATADFFVHHEPDPARAAAALERYVADRIPDRLGLDPRRDVQVLVPTHRGELGTKKLNLRLQAALNPGGRRIRRRQLRVGDRVMQTTNNYELDVMNGETGQVSYWYEDQKIVVVDFGEKTVEYPDQKLGQLSLAYAISIHKSQGSQWRAVVIVAHRSAIWMLERDLLYTAITRGQDLVVIVGEKQALQHAARKVGGNARHTLLEEWMSIAIEKTRESGGDLSESNKDLEDASKGNCENVAQSSDTVQEKTAGCPL